MMLGSVFLDIAVIRHDRTILRDQCVFPQDQNTDLMFLVLSDKISSDKRG